MPADPAPWHLDKFLEKFDIWVAVEDPPDDLRLLVSAWIFTRYDNPYAGMHREPGLPGLWFGEVPDSNNGKGQAVACAYWVDERTRTVRCDSFATLDTPI
ncbi:hypothetical protein [Catenuloplanes japonicus]|uniref:hypothetical protein n=1 Tax=Catenuloplanes japonicus TaxID=33876 RepID=UPI000524DE88|nr:hypothetical protein [Catenuloplanes japonicus]